MLFKIKLAMLINIDLLSNLKYTKIKYFYYNGNFIKYINGFLNR